MQLQLKRPICFFDLETTGVNIAKDRIVEISILKAFPDGSEQDKTWLVNPGMPIPEEATAVHGITNEKVANAPVFKEIAAEIYRWFKGSDLAGYNSDRFDIPLLAEEMLRADIDVDFKKHKTGGEEGFEIKIRIGGAGSRQTVAEAFGGGLRSF